MGSILCITLLLLLFVGKYSDSSYTGSSQGSSSINLVVSADTSPPPPPPTSGTISGPQPYFDPLTPTNVTALLGKTAYLSCIVRNLGNKTVSWVRHRDIHILTVGSYTYTSDQRFMAVNNRINDNWILQIKWAQKRDSGIYECQISTQPVRSLFINLNVVVPRAVILGGPDLHIDHGSTINLTCIVLYSPQPPAFIFWYHEDEVISYDSNRGGVSVITEKGDITKSYLLVQHAQQPDSGKYSCSPSNADLASVQVHILKGESPAAMQTGSAGLSNSSFNILALLLLCWLHNMLSFSVATSIVSSTQLLTQHHHR
ncbi:zwei Ig domain protein zig-8-like [Lycorma delicatula]|uniref:zwei Ig domain protein zig-8-like n=1 Tax=Lycorma delicatula TaxID=130591 RepID=UPI003F519EAA